MLTGDSDFYVYGVHAIVHKRDMTVDEFGVSRYIYTVVLEYSEWRTGLLFKKCLLIHLDLPVC